jgi:hypothetical protein
MVHKIKQHTDSWPEPGVWRGWRRQSDGKVVPSLCCPKCGHVTTLSLHVVGADGLVTPKAVCPTDLCDFRALIQLEGWTP